MLPHPLLSALGPEFLTGIIAFVILLANSLSAKNHRLLFRFTLMGLCIAILFPIIRSHQHAITFQNLYIANQYVDFSKVLILVLTFFIIIVIHQKPSLSDVSKNELTVYLLFAAVGAMLFSGSCHLFFMYTAFELLTFPALLLMTRLCYGEDSIFCSKNLFSIQLVGSLVLLSGIALLYCFTGLTEIKKILEEVNTAGHIHRKWTIFSLGWISLGALIKMGSFPFHGWLLNARTKTEFVIKGYYILICLIPVYIGISRIIIRMSYSFLNYFSIPIISFSIIILISGKILAISTREKPLVFFLYLLASQIGIIWLCPITAHKLYAIQGNPEGITAGLWFLLTFLLIFIGFSLSILIPDSSQTTLLSKFFGKNTLLIVSLICLSGFPLSAGFNANFFLLSSLLINSRLLLAAAVTVNILFSGIMSYKIFLEQKSSACRESAHRINRFIVVFTIIYSVFAIGSGFMPGFLYSFIYQTAKSIWS